MRWVETRSENLVALNHGRAQIHWVEMGFTDDAGITGMRLRVLADSGAYPGMAGMLAGGPTRMLSQGVYEIPKIDYGAVAVVTNTTPVGAFRGAGRPEATALLERIMDMAAVELDIDPAEIRRRNFIADDAFPYLDPDGCDLRQRRVRQAPGRRRCGLSGYDDLRQEQRARRERGDTRAAGHRHSAPTWRSPPGARPTEFGAVEVLDDGTATIRVGTSAHGQGHDTSFSMLVSDRLGIPMDDIRFVQSDTALVPRAAAPAGPAPCRSAAPPSSRRADAVLAKAKKLVAPPARGRARGHRAGRQRAPGRGRGARLRPQLVRAGPAASDPAPPEGWADEVPAGGEDRSSPTASAPP